jgi:hypothetical protein
MRGRIMGGLVVALAGLGGAWPASGQIAWEAPMLIAPGAPAGLGLFIMEPWPGDDWAGMLTYRTSPVPVGLGLRVGLGEGVGDDLAVFGGVDLSGYLARTGGDASLEILWFTGAGVGVGDDALFSFPLGISVGADLRSEDVSFRPYVAPRLVLDVCMGDDDPFCRFRDDPGVDVAADLGLDLAFDPSWLIRFAATVGEDREGVLIGLAVPTR